MKVERIEQPERWNQFVIRNSGPVFDMWEWGQLCEHYGHETTYLGAIENDDLLGVVPLVFMRSRLFADKLVSMPYSEYGSIVLADGAGSKVERRLLEETRALADRRNVDFVSLRGRSLTHPSEFTSKRRFVTFEIQVDRDTDEVWKDLDGSRRTHIRNGRDNDLEIREATSFDDLRRYYELYLENMQRLGSPPHSFEFIKAIWEEFDDTVSVDLLEYEGKLINGQMVFLFGDYCFDWNAVADSDYRDLQGGSLLLWHSIERACVRDVSRYSLGRTREGTGVYMFKKSWGGEKVWFDDYHYFPNGEVELPNPDNETYDRLSEAWQKVPKRVTKLVGPSIRKQISL